MRRHEPRGITSPWTYERVYLVAILHTTMDLSKRITELWPQLIQEVEMLHARYQAKKESKP